MIYDDTWEWNGLAWLQQSPAHVPPASRLARLAFDPAAGRVLHVNADAAVREWNGQDWLAIQPAVPILQRASVAVASDPGGDGVVVFGPALAYFLPPETWRWRAGAWTQLASLPVQAILEDGLVDGGSGSLLQYTAAIGGRAPTHRYDAASDQWLLVDSGPLVNAISGPICAFPEFGGLVTLTGGSTWIVGERHVRQLTVLGAPQSVRGLAHDSANARVLAVDFTGDTFAFDGQAWTTIATGGPALTLVGHHAGSGRFLAFVRSATGIDLWGLDSAGWSLIDVLSLATYNYGTHAAIDADRDVLVVVDGPSLYEWDGSWQSGPLPAAAGVALFPNPAGGVISLGGGPAAVWDGAAWTPVAAMPDGILGSDVAHQRFFRSTTSDELMYPFGLEVAPTDPAPGSTLTFTIEEPDRPGRVWWLLLAQRELPAITLPPVAHGVPLSIPLAADWLLGASIAAGVVGQLDTTGRASLSFSLPNAVELRGFEFHGAAVLLPGAMTPTQVSNPVHVFVHR
ncbi:MAG: hypothetical protein KDE27_31655 [Planctomycetes bacterium]|nr:hypothetical protein [Planctomycetota bacterium]